MTRAFIDSRGLPPEE